MATWPTASRSPCRTARGPTTVVPGRQPRRQHHGRSRRAVRRVAGRSSASSHRQAVAHQARLIPERGRRRRDLAARHLAVRQRARQPSGSPSRSPSSGSSAASLEAQVGRTKFAVMFLAAVIVCPVSSARSARSARGGLPVRPARRPARVHRRVSQVRFFFGIPAWVLGLSIVIADILQLTEHARRTHALLRDLARYRGTWQPVRSASWRRVRGSRRVPFGDRRPHRRRASEAPRRSKAARPPSSRDRGARRRRPQSDVARRSGRARRAARQDRAQPVSTRSHGDEKRGSTTCRRSSASAERTRCAITSDGSRRSRARFRTASGRRPIVHDSSTAIIAVAASASRWKPNDCLTKPDPNAATRPPQAEREVTRSLCLDRDSAGTEP